MNLCPQAALEPLLHCPASDLPSLQVSSHRPLSSWVSLIRMASPSLIHRSTGAFCFPLLCHSSPWPLSPCWLCESSEPLLFLGAGQSPHMLSRLLGTPSLTGLREWESHSEPHRRESAGVHAGCDMVKLGLLQGRGRGGGLTWS